MEYVALLRGINVGGTNKVVMSELREQVAGVGYTNVRTYINSGNLLFEAEADAPPEDVAQRVEDLLANRYDFPIRVALLSGHDYLAELHNLPDWWHGGVARRDALFLREAWIAPTCASASRLWSWATRPFISVSTPCSGASSTRRNSSRPRITSASCARTSTAR